MDNICKVVKILIVSLCSSVPVVIAFLIGIDVMENGTAGMDMMNLFVYHLDATTYLNVGCQQYVLTQKMYVMLLLTVHWVKTKCYVE